MDQKAPFTSRNVQQFKDLDVAGSCLFQGGTARFDRVWTDGFIFTFPSDDLPTRTKEIANIKSGDLTFESLCTDDYTVRVYGTLL